MERDELTRVGSGHLDAGAVMTLGLEEAEDLHTSSKMQWPATRRMRGVGWALSRKTEVGPHLREDGVLSAATTSTLAGVNFRSIRLAIAEATRRFVEAPLLRTGASQTELDLVGDEGRAWF